MAVISVIPYVAVFKVDYAFKLLINMLPSFDSLSLFDPKLLPTDPLFLTITKGYFMLPDFFSRLLCAEESKKPAQESFFLSVVVSRLEDLLLGIFIFSITIVFSF